MNLFLKDQSFSLLSAELTSADDRKRLVCGGDSDNLAPAPKKLTFKTWVRLPRNDLVAHVRLGDPAWNRIVLVTGAGVGKTTNMQFLASQITGRDSRRLPLLLRLDQESDLVDKLAREKNDAALLDSLVNDITNDQSRKPRIRSHLLRMRAAGRITLLIDGLDHAWSRGRLGDHLGTLLVRDWHACTIVLSGRPWAFRELWPLVQGDEWRFVRVNELQKPEVRYFLSYRLDGPNAPRETRRNWLGALADEARNLLATPRLLFLIAEMFHETVETARRSGSDPLEAAKALNIRSMADAYYKAYFEPGEVIHAESQTPYDHDRRNRRGLIAQGLDVFVKIPEVGIKYLGLDINDRPNASSHAERLRFVGGLLGAMAFEMYSNANAYRTNAGKASARQEPFAERVPEAALESFRGNVESRLQNAGLWKGRSLRLEFELLGEMNNRTVDSLLFHEMANSKGIVWHDKTVQAFFAAHFLTNHGDKDDRARAESWIVHRGGRRLDAFDEFWQFAAQMPKVDLARWRTIFERCYQSANQIRWNAPNEGRPWLRWLLAIGFRQNPRTWVWVQWHRQMTYYSLRLMAERFPEVIEIWRRPFVNLKQGTTEQRRIHAEVVGGFRPIPPEGQSKRVRFQMGSHDEYNPRDNEGQRWVEVGPFRLQEFPVTNEQYELFDGAHRSERWGGKHPAGRNASKHPVVNVTYLDAWIFAAWTGNRLPTEAEWEFACRAGTATTYWFGEEMDASKCNHGQDWRTGSTNEKGMLPSKNPWDLYDMHGNVWEWCDSLDEPGTSFRVLRGGCWYYGARFCRSAYRYRLEPGERDHYIGFRLAGVGAESSE